MLIYEIVRRIIMIRPSLNRNLSFTLPSGNRIIICPVFNRLYELMYTLRFQLDPEAPKEASLAIAPENKMQVF
jgi:hypothetical protein